MICYLGIALLPFIYLTSPNKINHTEGYAKANIAKTPYYVAVLKDYTKIILFFVLK